MTDPVHLPPTVFQRLPAPHWAAQHLDLFPDGQFFADLGESPEDWPTRPEDVLRHWLDLLGVAVGSVGVSRLSARHC